MSGKQKHIEGRRHDPLLIDNRTMARGWDMPTVVGVLDLTRGEQCREGLSANELPASQLLRGMGD